MMLAKLEDLARGNLASKEFSSSIPNKVDFFREVWKRSGGRTTDQKDRQK